MLHAESGIFEIISHLCQMNLDLFESPTLCGQRTQRETLKVLEELDEVEGSSFFL